MNDFNEALIELGVSALESLENVDVASMFKGEKIYPVMGSIVLSQAGRLWGLSNEDMAENYQAILGMAAFLGDVFEKALEGSDLMGRAEKRYRGVH